MLLQRRRVWALQCALEASPQHHPHSTLLHPQALLLLLLLHLAPQLALHLAPQLALFLVLLLLVLYQQRLG